MLAPLVLLAMVYGRKKKRGKWDNIVIMIVLCLTAGMALTACGGSTPAPGPVDATITVTSNPTVPPSSTPTVTITAEVNGQKYTATVPVATDAPTSTPTSTCTFTLIKKEPTEYPPTLGLGGEADLVYETFLALNETEPLHYLKFLTMAVSHEFVWPANDIEVEMVAETIVRNFTFICPKYGFCGDWGSLKSTIQYMAVKHLLTEGGRKLLLSSVSSVQELVDNWKNTGNLYLNQDSLFGWFQCPDPKWFTTFENKNVRDKDAPMDWGNKKMIRDFNPAGEGTEKNKVLVLRGELSAQPFAVLSWCQDHWWKENLTGPGCVPDDPPTRK